MLYISLGWACLILYAKQYLESVLLLVLLIEYHTSGSREGVQGITNMMEDKIVLVGGHG